MVWESFCEKDTAKIGETLAREAKPGEIYLLEGDLGGRNCETGISR